jgi:hypothetical protein
MLSTKTLQKYMSEVTPFLTNRRYCTGCATERPAADFIRVVAANGKTARWVCGACQRRESESWVTRGRRHKTGETVCR